MNKRWIKLTRVEDSAVEFDLVYDYEPAVYHVPAEAIIDIEERNYRSIAEPGTQCVVSLISVFGRKFPVLVLEKPETIKRMIDEAI